MAEGRMAGPDLSMYSTGAPPNALQTMSALQGMQLQGLQLQQMQQQFAAKQALGPIIQAAIDPKTGELDYNKAFVGLSSNPVTALLAGEFLNQAVQRQLTQADIALKKLQANREQQASIYAAIQGLLPLGNSVRQEDGIRVMTDLLNQGVIDQKHYSDGLQMIGRTKDGAGMAGLVKQVALSSMTAKDSMEKVLGGMQWQDTGDSHVLVQVPTMPGMVPKVLATVPKRLSPEQQAQQVPAGTDAAGTPQMQPLGGRVAEQGRPDLVTGPSLTLPGQPQGPGVAMPPEAAAGPGGSGGTTDSPPAVAVERPGAPPTPVGREGSAAAPPVSPVGGGKVSVGLPAAQKAAIEDSGEYGKGIMKGYEGLQDTMLTINHMESIYKKFAVGPGADARREAAQLLASMGVPKEQYDKITGGKNSLAAQQEFANLALTYATQQLRKAIEGSRITNLEFQTVVETKPNAKMTPEAIQAIFNHAKAGFAIEKAKVAGYYNWVKQGKDPVEWRTQEWPKRYDAIMNELKQHWAQSGVL